MNEFEFAVFDLLQKKLFSQKTQSINNILSIGRFNTLFHQRPFGKARTSHP